LTALILTAGQTTLAQLARVYCEELPVKLNRKAKPGIEAAAAVIRAAAANDQPVYGVNTGFGKLASLRIAPEDTATLQSNLILSDCCGVGKPISRRHARLMIVLNLLSLGRGASGVRWDLIELLEGMLARGVTPMVPVQGSVGASGDLAPLAHMTAVLIGHGEAEFQGRVMPGGRHWRRLD
jgi:histidine ammonia-lyase